MFWLIACLFLGVELKSAVGEIHVHDKSVLAVDLNKMLMPPLYNKYVAWGFSDMSLRIGNYDSEKVRTFTCMQVNYNHVPVYDWILLWYSWDM